VAWKIYLAAWLIVCVPLTAKADESKWIPPIPMQTLLAAKTAIIPFPKNVDWRDGDWVAPSEVTIACPKNELDRLTTPIGMLTDDLVADHTAVRVTPQEGVLSGSIVLNFSEPERAKPQAYELSVSKSQISIHGDDAAGAFYAVQTLRQMLRIEDGRVHVQAATIVDSPAFMVRGFMHDVGRNFQTIDMLKPQIRRFAEYKLNTFHWHLTDNPGWRIECRAYPELNDPKFQTRDLGNFYTYAQIRDLIQFAAHLNVRVIPELDMPGHSEYFQRVFGFAMASDKGMRILEKLIDEFCGEISAESCPSIHLGSDEVRVKDPKGFIDRMTARVRASHRKVMIWNPGLTGDAGTIVQLWNDKSAMKFEAVPPSPFIDSATGYLNNLDPLMTIGRCYFAQPCRRIVGDEKALGAILCLWPDVRVEDKSNIARYNTQWPGVLTFAESVWYGRPVDAPQLENRQPRMGSEALAHLSEFENRLAIHRDRYFAGESFPFVKSAGVSWKIVGPFLPQDSTFEPDKIKDSYQQGGRTLTWIDAGGATAHLAGRGEPGVLGNRPMISTAYALTYLHSDTDQSIRAWIGFEEPTRSNREYGGIPPAGKWGPFGEDVWVNDQPVSPPNWQHPGTHQALRATWGSKANEDPFTDEEFYWTRTPATVPMKKGWNKLLLRVPCGYTDQNWNFTFVPVKDNGMRFVEDLSIRFAITPTAK
jgi:hexosaminidase